jgi:hypothetical protein
MKIMVKLLIQEETVVLIDEDEPQSPEMTEQEEKLAEW